MQSWIRVARVLSYRMRTASLKVKPLKSSTRASFWVATMGAGALLASNLNGSEEVDESSEADKSWKPPARPDLPTFRAKDVEAHSIKEKGSIWVTFRGAVYDITEFHAIHPGGKIILQAAGGPLEPHWAQYSFHKTKDIFEVLEDLRVGNLAAEDIVEYDTELNYGYLPTLNKQTFSVKSLHPLNAETTAPSIVESFYTPVEKFYKRNHHEIPEVDIKTFKLTVKTDNGQRQFTLHDLQRRFKSASIAVTIQCAGNRRSGFANFRRVHGLDWHVGAIGNAKFTGVFLADVLAHVGLRRTSNGHVVFRGLDKDANGNHYETSIPLEKALDPKCEVLLAYEMNGQPLPVEHGFPLRVVVPGVVGARSVKWLSDITVQEDESSAQWQRMDYKSTPPGGGWSDVDFETLRPIQELPVTSAICIPPEGSKLPKGTTEVEVKGYAYTGGGSDILRVEVSADGGETWHSAKLHEHLTQPIYRRWAWVLWSCRVLIPSTDRPLELLCKATDSMHNCQPETPTGIWNVRGLVNNSWHRVRIDFEN